MLRFQATRLFLALILLSLGACSLLHKDRGQQNDLGPIGRQDGSEATSVVPLTSPPPPPVANLPETKQAETKRPSEIREGVRIQWLGGAGADYFRIRLGRSRQSYDQEFRIAVKELRSSPDPTHPELVRYEYTFFPQNTPDDLYVSIAEERGDEVSPFSTPAPVLPPTADANPSH